MVIRKSRGIPPLEVMGRRGADHVSPMRSVPDSTGETVSRGPDDYPTPRGDLWSRAQQPMVLRVPRGLLALVVAGAIGLLVVAYLVGHSRGAAAALATLEASNTEQTLAGNPLRRAPAGGDHGSAEQGGVGPGGAEQLARVDLEANPLGVDTRQPGLNYHYLALYDRDTAERLVRFLNVNGVESCAIPMQNGRTFQVIDLHGVPGDRVRDLGRQRKELLTQLGRAWKDQNNGPSDLSDAYLYRYSGR